MLGAGEPGGIWSHESKSFLLSACSCSTRIVIDGNRKLIPDSSTLDPARRESSRELALYYHEPQFAFGVINHFCATSLSEFTTILRRFNGLFWERLVSLEGR